MAELINPLIGTSPKATVHNAKCAITYLREWSPSDKDGAVTTADVERGRWLLLGAVERALGHALECDGEVSHGA